MSAHGSPLSAIWLAVRSIVWTILLPGVVAGYLPWRFFGLAAVQPSLRNPVSLIGLLCIGFGAVLLAISIWEFARSGRGTLSPIDPPRELVIRGLYRYVRNPMYFSVSLIVLGEWLLTWSRPLLVYWAAWFAIVNVIAIGYEEPNLRRRFGNAYGQCKREVGRWLPRLRSGQP
jgi:protein-S-isoprenylcysteine O-methyltransferase Ste14